MDIPLSQIEPQQSRQQWLLWLDEEIQNVRNRFGDDEEALIYWPDDYYAKMQSWWGTDARSKDPVELRREGEGVYRIIDGWHRVAVSHKLGLTSVPAIISESKWA